MAVQDLIKDLPRLLQPEAEKRIEEYGKELASGSDSLLETKAAYGRAVEAYLTKFPPAFSNDFVNNLKEYDKLIVFALRSGNKSLLSKWGINYPRSKTLSWMSDPLERAEYVDGLKDLRNSTPGAEGLYDQLINELK